MISTIVKRLILGHNSQYVEPIEPINNELVVPPPPQRSSKIFHPPERYLGMLIEDVKKIFFIGDKDHGDDPKIYDEVMSDIDSEKWLML